MSVKGKNMQLVDIRDKAEEAFNNYAKELLLERAFPDYRDGLTPVQRRVLYGMHNMGLSYKGDKPARQIKSARIVGEVMGKYHPHGDSGIYGAMANMSKEWLYLHPLVELIGNKGSSDGDNQASMRYCVVGSTLVTLDDNKHIKIEGIVEEAEPNTDNDIDLGVKDFEGNIVSSSKLFHSGKHPTKEIVLKNRNRLKGTYNHPVLILVKDEEGKPKYEWVLFEDIKVGDIVIQKIEDEGVKNKEDVPEDELASFLGGLVAEGCVSSEGRMSFNNTDKEYYEYVLRYIKNNEPKESYLEIERDLETGKKLYDISFKRELSNELIRRFPDIEGKLSAEKEIPKVILEGGRDRQVRFFQTLFEGDGSIVITEDKKSKRDYAMVSYSTISMELAQQMQTVLLGFGVNSRVRRIKGRNEIKLDILGHRNLMTYYTKIGFSGAKQGVFDEWVEYNEQYPLRSVDRTERIPYISEYIRDNLPDMRLPKDREKYPYLVGKRFSKKVRANNFDTLLNKKSGRYGDLMRYVGERFPELEHIINTDYIFTEVVGVNEGGVEDVYSIKVDTEDHSFITNGIVSHNTSSRLSGNAKYLTEGLNKKNLVDWQLNYEDIEYEPVYLPAQYPNLLVNGSMGGIAIGYVVDILPHNLNEVLDNAIEEIQGKELSPIAPDFPTGGVIVNGSELEEMYRTGKGKAVLRGRYKVVKSRAKKTKGKRKLVFYDVPYGVQKSKVIEKIREMINNNGTNSKQQLSGATKVKDASGSEGLSIEVDITEDADVKVLTELIYKYTQMETSHRYEFLTIKDGQPVRMSLEQYLKVFNEHRRETVIREKESDNGVIDTRVLRLDALIKLDGIRDEVIACIRNSNNRSHAVERLIEEFDFKEDQAEYLLSLQLSRLTKDNQEKYIKDRKDLLSIKERNLKLLGNEDLINKYIIAEYERVKSEIGVDRQTEVKKSVREVDLSFERVIPLEDTVVGVTPEGHIKRSSTRSYGATHNLEFEVFELPLTTHDEVVIFTDQGQVANFLVKDIPEMRWGDEGEPLMTFARDYHIDESVIGVVNAKELNGVVLFSNNNRVKRLENDDLLFKTKGSFFNIIPLEKGKQGFDGQTERVIGIVDADNELTVVVTASNLKGTISYGLALSLKDLSSSGRNAKGRKLMTEAKNKEYDSIYLSGTLLEDDYRDFGRASIKDVYPEPLDKGVDLSIITNTMCIIKSEAELEEEEEENESELGEEVNS